MLNKTGQQIPQVTFKVREDDQWKDVSTDDIFSGKKIALFALPGAFTPTCSSSHLPRYDELASIFKGLGIDQVVCLSVNDTFVMNAWSKDQGCKNIQFLPDGNGEFSEQMGMLVNKENIGFGKRSWRYSMIVDNGKIEKMFIEPEKEGDPFEVSDADTMLNYLSPDYKTPSVVTVFSKPGCPHCARAKELLTSKNYQYEEVRLGDSGVSFSSVRAITGKSTVPQIFIDGKHIGGADDLEAWFK